VFHAACIHAGFPLFTKYEQSFKISAVLQIFILLLSAIVLGWRSIKPVHAAGGNGLLVRLAIILIVAMAMHPAGSFC